MNNPYHEGIAARRAGLAKHENPYEGREISFTDFLCNPFIFTSVQYQCDEWARGWKAEDNCIRDKNQNAHFFV